MNHSSFANRHYVCVVCKKALGTRRDRLIGKKTLNVTIVSGKEYCDKCFIDMKGGLKNV